MRPLSTHHILPTYNSSGAPPGLFSASEGSCWPSRPNQLPQRTGSTSPFFVILPVASTRNTPPPLEDDELVLDVELLLVELVELDEVLLVELEEVLEVLLVELDEVLEVLDELVDEVLEELEELGQLLITPPLPDWLLQVVRPIQLWLFSQPQPLS